MDALARALDGFADSWRYFARAKYGLFEQDGILAGATGGRVNYCNQALVIGEAPDAYSSLAAAMGYFDGFHLPFMVQVPDGSSFNAVVGRAGLIGTAKVPFMLLDPIDDSTWRQVPPELEIAPAVAADMSALESLLNVTFAMPLDSVRAFALSRFIGHAEVQMFVGRIDGKIVTTATSLLSGDTAGVFQVGTLEQHRGKGLGNVMTGHAIKAAVEKGAHISYLQASALGYPVYEKMGFKTVLTHTMFERP